MSARPQNPVTPARFTIADLRQAIRTIPDYPKPGVQFRDITTLLGNAGAFRQAIDDLEIGRAHV